MNTIDTIFFMIPIVILLIITLYKASKLFEEKETK